MLSPFLLYFFAIFFRCQYLNIFYVGYFAYCFIIIQIQYNASLSIFNPYKRAIWIWVYWGSGRINVRTKFIFGNYIICTEMTDCFFFGKLFRNISDLHHLFTLAIY